MQKTGFGGRNFNILIKTPKLTETQNCDKAEVKTRVKYSEGIQQKSNQLWRIVNLNLVGVTEGKTANRAGPKTKRQAMPHYKNSQASLQKVSKEIQAMTKGCVVFSGAADLDETFARRKPVMHVGSCKVMRKCFHISRAWK